MSAYSDIARRIMVALDYPDVVAAEKLLFDLRGIPCYFKVGMQLFYTAGPAIIYKLKEAGYHVFLDLKLHDIPNTVKGGAESITALGVDMFNIHIAGGIKMMESACEGIEKGMVRRGSQDRPILIGVTQLTSTSQQMLNEDIGIAGTVEQAVLRYSRMARAAGLDGVVASPLEVVEIKRALGETFLTVTPGIRPEGAETADQARTMTPREAFAQGTDYIVIGRPINAAPNPRHSLESILEELD